jgi:hypothetical protein
MTCKEQLGKSSLDMLLKITEQSPHFDFEKSGDLSLLFQTFAMAPSSYEKSEFIDMVVKEAMQFKTWVQLVFDDTPKVPQKTIASRSTS